MAKKKKLKEAKQKTVAELAPIQRELDFAYKRINSNSVRRVRWLLDFAYRDLDNLGQGEWINIGWEVVMFGIDKSPKQITADDVKPFLDNPHGQKPEVWWSLVRSFQKDMKSIFDGGMWQYRYPLKVKTISLPYARSPESESEWWEPLGGEELLLLRAFELVDREKDRILVCENPKCRLKFVATKKGRSRFHSPTCSAYVRIRRSREKQV
jgi:hypothetical protein